MYLYADILVFEQHFMPAPHQYYAHVYAQVVALCWVGARNIVSRDFPQDSLVWPVNGHKLINSQTDGTLRLLNQYKCQFDIVCYGAFSTD